jgi:pilus assembly protein CpaB
MARSVAGATPGRTNRRFLIIAVLFAALSGALVFAWMSSQGKGDGGGGTSAVGSQEAVVAKTEIKQRTEITAEMLEIKSIPANLIVEGHFTTVEEVVGKVTKLPIRANEQVVLNSVVDTDRPTVDALAQVVPNGRRGFSVKALPVNTAGGLILPGDYVDVVWVCCTGENVVALTKTVAQNVQVAAIATNIVSSGPVASSDGTGIDDDPVAADEEATDAEAVTATLLLTPKQSHLVVMAEDTGDLRLSLRGVNDTQIAPPEEDFTLMIELLPKEVLNALPPELWPDGYKDEPTQ